MKENIYLRRKHNIYIPTLKIPPNEITKKKFDIVVVHCFVVVVVARVLRCLSHVFLSAFLALVLIVFSEPLNV